MTATDLLPDRAVQAAPVPLLELTELGKRFGSIVALDRITAAVDGRIIGLLGPNGAGKSTLLKCLLGLIPYTGDARVLGVSSRTDGATVRDRVGYMPENDAYLSGMSAVELCTYAAELSGLPRVEAIQRAHAALYYAGLEEKRYQPIESYSTGMKQRVKLAQALVHDPELLFLDEPTNGLDPRSRDEMLELINQMPERRGCKIVLSTHLLPDVERVCDEVVIMHHGRLRFSGTVAELRRTRGKDGELVVEVKADAAGFAAALEAAGATCEVTSPVALAVTLPRGAGAELVFRTARGVGAQIRQLEARRESLEAAFLRVVGAELDVAAQGTAPDAAHGGPA